MFYGAKSSTVFKALLSTADGRITAGKLYTGNFAWLKHSAVGAAPGWRIELYDNKAEWTTFDPKIFGPADK